MIDTAWDALRFGPHGAVSCRFSDWQNAQNWLRAIMMDDNFRGNRDILLRLRHATEGKPFAAKIGATVYTITEKPRHVAQNDLWGWIT